MFTALSEQLGAVLRRLTGRGVLSEQDVNDALRDIRRHLLEADVSFEVTRGFVERVREQAVGEAKLGPVNPGQQVVKLVRDEIARMLGASDADLAAKAPARAATSLNYASVGQTVILLVGLQGSGKTTTIKLLLGLLGYPANAVRGAVGVDRDHRHVVGDDVMQLAGDTGAFLQQRPAGALRLADGLLLQQLPLGVAPFSQGGADQQRHTAEHEQQYRGALAAFGSKRLGEYAGRSGRHPYGDEGAAVLTQ